MSKIEKAANELLAVLGRENVSVETADLIAYSRDASEEEGMPDIVVWPVSTEHVVEVVKIARKYKLPVVARGAGTCRSGGAVPIYGGIVVVLTKMNRILEVDPENLQVYTETGVTLRELNSRLKRYNLFVPPDPASSDVCTIGGCIAENAGGIRAIKYGTFRDWVMEIETVLPTAKIVKLGAKTKKSVSGYDLLRLFVGSEGTLGIFTKARLKLHSIPEYRATIAAYFEDAKNAVRTVCGLLLSGVTPSAAELMDSSALAVVSDYIGERAPEGSTLLLLEFDGEKSQVDVEVEKGENLCAGNNAVKITVANGEWREKIWRARKAVSPALARIKPSRYAEDIAVPMSKIAEMLEFIQFVSRKYGLIIATYGHVGDGNLHPSVLFDPEDEHEARRAEKAIREIVNKAVELGGTLSGEHGIGLSKRKFFEIEHSAYEIELMRAIKRAVDPDGIMNPGKILP